MWGRKAGHNVSLWFSAAWIDLHLVLVYSVFTGSEFIVKVLLRCLVLPPFYILVITVKPFSAVCVRGKLTWCLCMSCRQGEAVAGNYKWCLSALGFIYRPSETRYGYLAFLRYLSLWFLIVSHVFRYWNVFSWHPDFIFCCCSGSLCQLHGLHQTMSLEGLGDIFNTTVGIRDLQWWILGIPSVTVVKTLLASSSV